MTSTKRYRMRYDFQLNIAKDDEFAISEQIASLKTQSLYSKTVRDGIRLVCDLRAGNLDALFELFPWVRVEFLEYMASVKPQKTEAEIEIQRQLKQIEELLANTNNPAPLTNGVGAPKAMSIPSIPSPEFADDDEELVIKKSESSGTQAAENFLAAAFALQGG